MRSTRRDGPGFSLVELLVALGLIMSLTMLVAGVFQIPLQDAEETILKTNLRAVRKSLQQFYNDHHRYPYNGQDEFGNVVTFLDDATSELVHGVHSDVGEYATGTPRYLLAIPVDPSTKDKSPTWHIIPWDGDGDWDPSTHDLGLDGVASTPPDTGEADGEPSLGEPNVDEDSFGNGDEDADGRVDEDPPDVKNIRSYTLKYRRM